jgi:hypothetical protein
VLRSILPLREVLSRSLLSSLKLWRQSSQPEVSASRSLGRRLLAARWVLGRKLLLHLGIGVALTNIRDSSIKRGVSFECAATGFVHPMVGHVCVATLNRCLGVLPKRTFSRSELPGPHSDRRTDAPVCIYTQFMRLMQIGEQARQ